MMSKIENNWIDRMLLQLTPTLGLKRIQARALAQEFNTYNTQRHYEGASLSNRTKNWVAPSTSQNSEHRQASHLLRARSRDLIRNNPYANKGVSVLVTNTVGTGFIPQIESSNKTLECFARKKWREWAETTDCDYEGRHDFYGLQALAFRSVVESGEILIRLHKMKTESRINVRLQLLEPDLLDSYREYRSDSSVTLQGIEITGGRRTGYYLFEEHPGDHLTFGVAGISSHRFRADEILHIYRVDRPGQIRGVPWLSPVMLRLRNFDEFEDAYLEKSKLNACITAFLRDMEPPPEIRIKRDPEESASIKPGAREYLPPGKDIVFANPPAVEGHDAFTKNQLYAVAAGLGITFEALTGNLSQVNFSSARLGWLEFHRNIEQWRHSMLIPQLCQPVWDVFSNSLKIMGIKAENFSVKFTPPRRELINPSEEIPSIITAIRSGLISYSEAIREMGYSVEEHLEEVKRDFKALDSNGLKLELDPRYFNQSGLLHSEGDTATEVDDEDKEVA